MLGDRWTNAINLEAMISEQENIAIQGHNLLPKEFLSTHLQYLALVNPLPTSSSAELPADSAPGVKKIEGGAPLMKVLSSASD